MSLSPKNLARIAARAAGDPAFCGWVLARYAESEGIDAAELTRRLGLSAEAFGHLSLCLRPAANRFAVDVRQIADHVGVDADVLAAIVRRADVLDRMRGAASNTSADKEGGENAGALLAARARWKKNARPSRKETP